MGLIGITALGFFLRLFTVRPDERSLEWVDELQECFLSGLVQVVLVGVVGGLLYGVVRFIKFAWND